MIERNIKAKRKGRNNTRVSVLRSRCGRYGGFTIDVHDHDNFKKVADNLPEEQRNSVLADAILRVTREMQHYGRDKSEKKISYD